MSNLTRLQTNNTNLQACIDKANALPDAGSSGGGSLETCSVTINFVGGATSYGEAQQAYVHYTNITEYVAQTLTQDTTVIENVIKNSLFILRTNDGFEILGGGKRFGRNNSNREYGRLSFWSPSLFNY